MQAYTKFPSSGSCFLVPYVEKKSGFATPCFLQNDIIWVVNMFTHVNFSFFGAKKSLIHFAYPACVVTFGHARPNPNSSGGRTNVFQAIFGLPGHIKPFQMLHNLLRVNISMYSTCAL